MNNPEYIIIHHTALPYTTTSVEAIRRWQVDKRGFGDIGYHFVVRSARGLGVAEPGRDVTKRGAHCVGYNSRSIGVCIAGDWSKMDPSAHRRIFERAVALVRKLQEEYSISTENVLGHREAHPGHTDCPGLKLDMDAFRALLE